MLFCNIQQNSKANKMTKLKIVMAIVMFIALSNGSVLSNFINLFSGSTPNLLSIERFLSDIFNISKIVSESGYLTIGIGFVIFELAFIMAIAFTVILSFKKSLRQNNLDKDTSSEIGINLVEYSTNDIYLQTNKLIC